MIRNPRLEAFLKAGFKQQISLWPEHDPKALL